MGEFLSISVCEDLGNCILETVEVFRFIEILTHLLIRSDNMSSTSCSACKKSIGYSSDVRCSNCSLPFHSQCIPLASGTSGGDGDTSSRTCSSCMIKTQPLTVTHFQAMMDQLTKLNESVIKCTESVNRNNLLIAQHSVEINSCRQEIEALKVENCNLRQKVELLESSSGGSATGQLGYSEIRLRLSREPNLILAGIPEDIPAHSLVEVVGGVLRPAIHDGGLDVVGVGRIGRRNVNGPRILQVKLKDATSKYTILKNKAQVRDPRFPNMKIFPDLTPMQTDTLKRARRELSRRIQNGERNLTIRYINNEPQIVESYSSDASQTAIHGANGGGPGASLLPDEGQMPKSSGSTSKRTRDEWVSPNQNKKQTRVDPN